MKKKIGKDLRNLLEKQMIWIALEEIDAALFTGDIFHNEEELKELKRYLIRWVREVKNIEEMLKEDENVDKNK